MNTIQFNKYTAFQAAIYHEQENYAKETRSMTIICVMSTFAFRDVLGFIADRRDLFLKESIDAVP